MTHTEWRQLVSQFMDGETTSEESSAVTAHVRSCVECQHSTEAWRSLREEVRQAATAELPVTFSADLREAMTSREESSLIWGTVEPFARRMVEVLALVALCALSLSVLRPAEESVMVDRSMTAIQADTGAAAVLLKTGELTKADVFLAAVTR